MEFFCATTAKQAFIFDGSTIFYLGTLSEAEKGRCPDRFGRICLCC